MNEQSEIEQVAEELKRARANVVRLQMRWGELRRAELEAQQAAQEALTAASRPYAEKAATENATADLVLVSERGYLVSPQQKRWAVLAALDLRDLGVSLDTYTLVSCFTVKQMKKAKSELEAGKKVFFNTGYGSVLPTTPPPQG